MNIYNIDDNLTAIVELVEILCGLDLEYNLLVMTITSRAEHVSLKEI